MKIGLMAIALCLMFLNTSVLATSATDRGWLKVERLGQGGQIGQPITVEIIDSTNKRHEFGIDGAAKGKSCFR